MKLFPLSRLMKTPPDIYCWCEAAAQATTGSMVRTSIQHQKLLP